MASYDDFFIVDFEGEPSRAVSRAAAQEQLPLRDVAGMLRSFDYAAASALQRTRGVPSRSVGPWAVEQGLASRAKQAFLNELSARDWRLSFDPAERKTSSAVLDFFMVEKALYEICYEAANRPDWIQIPLAGVWR